MSVEYLYKVFLIILGHSRVRVKGSSRDASDTSNAFRCTKKKDLPMTKFKPENLDKGTHKTVWSAGRE